MRLHEIQVSRSRRSAFTLMEMLVVVAIIVILASIGGFYFFGQADQSRKSAAKLQAQVLSQACETYSYAHQGQFPPSLETLLTKDEVGGPYLTSADKLKNPWGGMYQLTPTTTDTGALVPLVITQAPDGSTIKSH